MKKLIFAFVVSALLIGCQSKPDYSLQKKEISHMLLNLDSLKSQVASINQDTLTKWADFSAARVSVLQRRLRDTAIADQNHELISELIADAKFLRKMQKAKEDLQNGIDLSEEQLNNLLSDLEHNALDSTATRKYFNEEKIEFKRLSLKVKKRVELAKKAIEKLDSLQPNIDSLMNYLDQNVFIDDQP